jgi:predicted GIY-YIG superfamily endonuclease
MKNYCVYMFLDVEENPLYIGLSENLATRIEVQHFKTSTGNLTQECIEKTSRVLYHKAESIDDMKTKERYLINTLNPKYNIKMNNKSRFSFTIDIDWKLYSLDLDNINTKKSLKTESFKNKLINHKLEDDTSNLFISKLKYNSYLKVRCDHLVEEDNPFAEKFSGYNGSDQDLFLIKINNEYYFHHKYYFGQWANGEDKRQTEMHWYTVYDNTEIYNKKFGVNAFVLVESKELDYNLFRDIDWMYGYFHEDNNVHFSPENLLFIKISIIKELLRDDGNSIFNDSHEIFLKKIVKSIDKYLPEKTSVIINENQYPRIRKPIDTSHPNDGAILLNALSNLLKRNEFQFKDEMERDVHYTFITFSLDNLKSENITKEKAFNGHKRLKLPVIKRQFPYIQKNRKIRNTECWTNFINGVHCNETEISFDIDIFLYNILLKTDFNTIELTPESILTLIENEVDNTDDRIKIYINEADKKRKRKNYYS